MSSSKLTIVSVDNFCQQMGNTEYVIFTCLTDKQQELSVAVSYNALLSRGVKIDLIDSIIGSTLIANDDTNIKTLEFITGTDRVQGIVDGTLINNDPDSKRFGEPITILLLNKANSTLIKCSTYMADTKDLVSTTQAKVIVEQTKEKVLNAERRKHDRLRARASATPVVLTEKVKDAELETNDLPFED